MNFRVVIPARFGSTRLPGKPLVLLAGKPMIAHVHERASRSRAVQVLVATDDPRIETVCRQYGATAVLTAANHTSGTDRVAEVAQRQGWSDADIVVNVQGDEPLLPPVLIDQVAQLLSQQTSADIATLGTPIEALRDFLDPNVVKVVTTSAGMALYFSRAPIPWPREGALAGLGSQTQFADALRHLGIYAYRVAALKRLTSLPPSRLEHTEKLEQLRALENGMRIVVAVAAEPPGPGVDTAEDLTEVAKLL